MRDNDDSTYQDFYDPGPIWGIDQRINPQDWADRHEPDSVTYREEWESHEPVIERYETRYHFLGSTTTPIYKTGSLVRYKVELWRLPDGRTIGRKSLA